MRVFPHCTHSCTGVFDDPDAVSIQFEGEVGDLGLHEATTHDNLLLFPVFEIWVVPLLSVVPLKIGNNNCKPGETYRKMPSIC